MKLTRLRFLIIMLIGCVAALFLVPLGMDRLGREERHEDKPYQGKSNYDLIEDGLYMGGYVEEPPPGTKAVLNLSMDADTFRCEEHLWKPINDGPPVPSIDWLRSMVEFIDRKRKAGETVFVHCSVGMSRSGMVAIAYFMFKNNWTRDEALAFVRSKRPITKPNPAFMELLSEWEGVLKE